ncbi:hypothetical protein T265_05691 [Opisthorchis viverrini]|uniref:Kinesin motor domain protein n=1 Tax=Opisthorchis viverrini TaxID=6198 RepID=A0A075AEZ6_OPIVI|nr:hypothetical protein T265_05691 [Opisthorchis viverrini]KER27224.1 hypothetical protein T265_05691 [Opisthorchis viverrini]
MSSVKVAVRVRPFNKREISAQSTCVISMDGKTTSIRRPNSKEPPKTFEFDHSYWSHTNSSDTRFCNQSQVYEQLGVNTLRHAMEGYNVCIFAYGQTGSGKSYTMMGGKPGVESEEGIIPRLCRDLFNRLGTQRPVDPNFSACCVQNLVEVSYIEIYCERVRDLLNPKSKSNLRVREHPIMGPYVEDLSKCVVRSFDEINDLLDVGNKARTVAATNMNETSSRSHAVFTMVVTQKLKDIDSGLTTEKVSKISLVDLAGSERADATGATDIRLKEGANINKSLTTLGKVIAGLAELLQEEEKAGLHSLSRFRGNSHTTMIATISPADINYEETLSTLRYADRAKHIVCKAVVNEDPNAKLIRELKAEVARLQHILIMEGIDIESEMALTERNSNQLVPTAPVCTAEHEAIMEALRASEKLIAELNETMEEKLQRAEQLREQREHELKEMGIAIHNEIGVTGIFTPKDTPHLVNLNEDPSMSECLIYYLKEGKTRVGQLHTESVVEIGLSGEFILKEHCIFFNDKGIVHFEPCANAECYVNGSLVKERIELFSGARVILGKSHVFRFNNPVKARDKKASSADLSASMIESIDWSYAICELLDKQGVDLRKEMEDRLLEMEQQFRREREESNRRFEEQRRDYEDRIQLLQEQVDRQSMLSSATQEDSLLDYETTSECNWSEREQQLAHWALCKWRAHQFTSLRDQLWENAIYLKEANALSVELGKTMRFQFTLVTETPYSPLPMGLSQSSQSPGESASMEAWSADDNKTPKPCGAPMFTSLTTSDQRACNDLRNGILTLFHSTEFNPTRSRMKRTHVAVQLRDVSTGIKRLLLMRQHYERETDFVVASADEDARSVKSDVSTFQNEQDNKETAKESAKHKETEQATGGDPFQIRDSWFRFVGRCFIYLSHLIFGVSLIQKVAIVDEHSRVCGFLKVLIEPVSQNNCDNASHKTGALQEPPITQVSFEVSSYVAWKFPTTEEVIAEELSFRDEEGDLQDDLVMETPRPHGATEKPEGDNRYTNQLSNQFFPQNTLSDDSNYCESVLRESLFEVDNDYTDLVCVGEEYMFAITIIQISGVSPDFTDIFCQYYFQHKPADIICTQPMKNAPDSETVGFTTKTTLAFFDYVRHHPLAFELYGHMNASSEVNYGVGYEDLEATLPRRYRMMVPLLIPGSAPVPSTRLNAATPPVGSVLVRREDILVWFEILEIDSNGEYNPVPVDRLDEAPCQGVFLIHQGLQRRIAVTLVYEVPPDAFLPENSSSLLLFQDVHEVVIGRVRDTAEWLEPDSRTRIISLSLLPARYFPQAGDDRIFFRFEAAWDSSLHSSPLLNRVTPVGQRIYLTMSCYLDVSGCTRPICLTKDLAMMVFPRESKLSVPRSLRSLWSSICRVSENSRLSAVYDLQLRQPLSSGRKVTASPSPSGGIENNGAAGSAVKFGSPDTCLASTRIPPETVCNPIPTKDDKHSDSGLAASTITTADSVNLETHDPIQLGISHSRLTRSAEYKTDSRLYTLDPLSRSFFEWDETSLVQGSPNEARKQLMMSRCVEVLTSLLQMTNKLLSPGELSEIDFNQEQPRDGAENVTNSRSEEDRTWPKILDSTEINSSNPSNSQTNTEENFEIHQSVTMDSLQLPSVRDTGRIPRLIGECDEVRVSPVVSRKGYLLVLEEKTGGWLRRWAVVRRPFLYLYENEQDPTERCLVNLTTSQLEYDINVAFASDLSPQSLNGHQGTLSKNTSVETKLSPTELVSSRYNMFTLVTQQHTFLIQTLADGGSDISYWAEQATKEVRLTNRLSNTLKSDTFGEIHINPISSWIT